MIGNCEQHVVDHFQREEDLSFRESERSDPESAEAELRRVVLALRLISKANKSPAKASDVISWVNSVCRAAIRTGGYRMVWVGLAQDDEGRSVRPLALAGAWREYIKNANATWSHDPRARGPGETVIRTGKPYVTRDISKDSSFAKWREEALRHGYQSSLCLPLSVDGHTFGFLAMYSAEVDAFGQNEIEILEVLAKGLADGLVLFSRTGVHRTTDAEALAESQRKLRQAERISQLAQFERNLETNVLIWSEGMYRIFGLDPQKKTSFTFPEFLELVHPQDRDYVRRTAMDSIQQIGPFVLNYRIVRPDGEIRYVQAEAEIIRDLSGNPVRSIGFLQDVTDKNIAKNALEDANRALEVKNAALHEILADIQKERDKIGQRINKNVQDLIQPLVQGLKQGASRKQQRVLDQLENSLRNIVSPFIDALGEEYKSLTPTELRVCDYVERGLAVKQIAELEYVSPETVAVHRRNIRHKLRIAHQKINLASYLQSLRRGDSGQRSANGHNYIG